jgi:hypothetical protein
MIWAHYLPARALLLLEALLILFKGPSEGLFTEGCFVLVEGDYSDEETLVVIAIGHPPSERRAAAR